LLSADRGTGLVTVGAGGDHRHRPGHRRARSAGLIPGGGAIHRGRRHPVVHLIRAGPRPTWPSTCSRGSPTRST
jgi:hypothetical protein